MGRALCPCCAIWRPSCTEWVAGAVVITGGHLPEANDYLSIRHPAGISEQVFRGSAHRVAGQLTVRGAPLRRRWLADWRRDAILRDRCGGGKRVRPAGDRSQLTRSERASGPMNHLFRLNEDKYDLPESAKVGARDRSQRTSAFLIAKMRPQPHDWLRHSKNWSYCCIPLAESHHPKLRGEPGFARSFDSGKLLVSGPMNVSRNSFALLREYGLRLLSFCLTAGCGPRPFPAPRARWVPTRASNDVNTRKGFDNFYNLEYDKAIREFEAALQAHPDDPFAVNHLLSAVIFKELLSDRRAGYRGLCQRQFSGQEEPAATRSQGARSGQPIEHTVDRTVGSRCWRRIPRM